ncbi:MAG: ABC transporter permease [Silvibacterium sp.]
MRNFFADLRYALRQLRRSPGFAVLAVLTLTMAIGANVIVFGVVNAIVLHPLPVPESNRIFTVQGKDPSDFTISYPNYEDIRDRNRTFSGLAVTRMARLGLDANGVAEPVWGYEVSGNYFQMLGVQPILGRFITPADDTKVNGDPYAVLSYDCWQTRFGGDPKVVGRTFRINKQPFTVVAVAPKYFNGTERLIWPQVWVPIHDAPEIEGYNWLNARGDGDSWLVGRLKAGVTVAQANADLANVALQLAKQYPDDDKHITLRVSPAGLFGDLIGGPVRAFLFGVMLLAFLVLFAACANLGGLFTARMTDRARELGIRIAVGASRARLLRQLLTESISLAVLGGAAAAFLATVLLHALTVWHPSTEIPIAVFVEPGATVYVFASLLALFTGALFGILPARQIWRTDPNTTLKAGSADANHRRFSLRDILLVVQIALCCLLVTSSFVAVRGLVRSLRVHIGFQPQNVTLASMDVHLADYKDSGPIQQRLLDAVKRIPGIESAALASATPLSVDSSNTSIFPPGTTNFNAQSTSYLAQYFKVSPGYFHTAGTRLLGGREFTDHDDAKAPNVAIVNERLAKELFGTVDAVGKSFPSDSKTLTQVVGVVEDGKYEAMAEDPKGAIFWPIAQQPESGTVLLVRSYRPPSEMIPAVRRAIAGVDPALPVFSVSTWQDALGFFMLPERAATVALGVLGALALMLAVTGIFGLANYTVSRRMRELGLRVALGAQNRHVLHAALGRAALLLGIGSIAGLALGFTASRVLASIVYGATASASDPVVILSAVLTMGAIGILSAAWPAQRALSAQPAALLREQ